MTETILRYQIAFAGWANERVLAAAVALQPEELAHDFRSSEHSILATLVHIYRADRIWLGRLHGETLTFAAEGDETLAALKDNWPPLGRRWIDWSQGVPEGGFLAECTYHDLRGNPWTQPLWQIILHVVNHATHHRGQVMGFIRALGHTPPNVDSITFARESLRS